MKPELLAPAGSPEALQAALAYGADALYLGGKSFGARAFAANFSLEELAESVKAAHLLGANIYVTVNTLIYQHELAELRAFLSELVKLQVDGVLVQDLGVIRIIQNEFESLRLHASTQMNLHNQAGLNFAHDNGFVRIVLGRECSLKEIKSWQRHDLELEVFVQGSLCFCYSGACSLSFSAGGRSANRGACAQPCRLPYRLFINDKQITTQGDYLLSPKDLYTADRLKPLIEAGIGAFKIEGRMKKPEYVAAAVRLYRSAIDNITKHQDTDLTGFTADLKQVYHRGFTGGYLFEDPNWIGLTQPNHQGKPIGVITKIDKGRMQVKLSEPLRQSDGIRIITKNKEVGFMVNRLYVKELLANTGNPGQEVWLKAEPEVAVGDIVYKTLDSQLNLALLKEIKANPRRVDITMEYEIEVGKPLRLTLNDGVHQVMVEGDVVQKARKAPWTRDLLILHLDKVKDSVYRMTSISGSLGEDCFFPVATLNTLRTKAIQKLDEVRLKRPVNTPFKAVLKEPKPLVSLPYDCLIQVETKAQAAMVQKLGLPVIHEDLQTADILALRQINEHSVYPKAKAVLIHSHGDLLQSYPQKIASSTLYAANSEALKFLAAYGVSGAVLPYELDNDDARLLAEATKKELPGFTLYQQVYGRVQLMIAKHCCIKQALSLPECQTCHQSACKLLTRDNRELLILGDMDCHMRLFGEVQTAKQIVGKPFFRFVDETPQTVKEILEAYLKAAGAK